MTTPTMSTEQALALLNRYAAIGCDVPDDHMRVDAALAVLRQAIADSERLVQDHATLTEEAKILSEQRDAENARLRAAVLDLDPPGLDYPEKMAGCGWIVEDGFDAGVDAANEWWRGAIRDAVEGKATDG